MSMKLCPLSNFCSSMDTLEIRTSTKVKVLSRVSCSCPLLNSALCVCQCKHVHARCKCTLPIFAFALHVSEYKLNQRVGTIPTCHQAIPKRLCICLQGYGLQSQSIVECTLTIMPSSVPKLLLNQSFVGLLMVALPSTVLRS